MGILGKPWNSLDKANVIMMAMGPHLYPQHQSQIKRHQQFRNWESCKMGQTKDWEEKEKKVREILSKRYDTTFKKKKLPIGMKSDGTIREHEFDFISPDGSIMGEVQTFTLLKSRFRPSGKIDTTFQACYVLEKAKAKKRTLVLTDKEFCELFRKEADGIVSEQIDIQYIPVQ